MPPFPRKKAAQAALYILLSFIAASTVISLPWWAALPFLTIVFSGTLAACLQ
jgi:hypothetical protein